MILPVYDTFGVARERRPSFRAALVRLELPRSIEVVCDRRHRRLLIILAASVGSSTLRGL